LSTKTYLDHINDPKIIDLESEVSTCDSLPRFPQALSEAFGGLDYSNKLLICGGADETVAINFYCRTFSDGRTRFN
jgi:hypothetical protein